MAKIKNPDQYRAKLEELNREGATTTHHVSDHHKKLEAETADYAQHLHHQEVKGRPKPSTSPATTSSDTRSATQRRHRDEQ